MCFCDIRNDLEANSRMIVFRGFTTDEHCLLIPLRDSRPIVLDEEASIILEGPLLDAGWWSVNTGGNELIAERYSTVTVMGSGFHPFREWHPECVSLLSRH